MPIPDPLLPQHPARLRLSLPDARLGATHAILAPDIAFGGAKEERYPNGRTPRAERLYLVGPYARSVPHIA
eukprot:451729-Rhodomonas_salina.2